MLFGTFCHLCNNFAFIEIYLLFSQFSQRVWPNLEAERWKWCIVKIILTSENKQRNKCFRFRCSMKSRCRRDWSCRVWSVAILKTGPHILSNISWTDNGFCYCSLYELFRICLLTKFGRTFFVRKTLSAYAKYLCNARSKFIADLRPFVQLFLRTNIISFCKTFILSRSSGIFYSLLNKETLCLVNELSSTFPLLDFPIEIRYESIENRYCTRAITVHCS